MAKERAKKRGMLRRGGTHFVGPRVQRYFLKREARMARSWCGGRGWEGQCVG
jgi:hypothetical protein